VRYRYAQIITKGLAGKALWAGVRHAGARATGSLAAGPLPNNWLAAGC